MRIRKYTKYQDKVFGNLLENKKNVDMLKCAKCKNVT